MYFLQPPPATISATIYAFISATISATISVDNFGTNVAQQVAQQCLHHVVHQRCASISATICAPKPPPTRAPYFNTIVCHMLFPYFNLHKTIQHKLQQKLQTKRGDTIISIFSAATIMQLEIQLVCRSQCLTNVQLMLSLLHDVFIYVHILFDYIILIRASCIKSNFGSNYHLSSTYCQCKNDADSR